MLGLPARGAKPFDVVGLGQNSLDLVIVVAEYPVPDSTAPVDAMHRLPGGEVATAMVACARLGCRTRYIGSVGRDPEGEAVRAALAAADVELEHLRTVEAPTRTAVILVDRAGRRAVLSSRDPGLDLPASEPDERVVTSGRILLVDGSDPPASARALAAARRAGVPTVIDIDGDFPGARDLLRGVNVVIAARTVVAAQTGSGAVGAGLARMAADSGAEVVIATLGEEGSLAWTNGREICTPAFSVAAVDTTGAGDAFRAGFMASWIRHGEAATVESCLRDATAVAAINCTALGAQAGLPEWRAVDTFVTSAAHVRSK